jgi:hypothetical protein
VVVVSTVVVVVVVLSVVVVSGAVVADGSVEEVLGGVDAPESISSRMVPYGRPQHEPTRSR